MYEPVCGDSTAGDPFCRCHAFLCNACSADLVDKYDMLPCWIELKIRESKGCIEKNLSPSFCNICTGFCRGQGKDNILLIEFWICNAQNGNAFVIINTHHVAVIAMTLNPSVRVRAAMSKNIVSVEVQRSIRSAVKTMVRKDLGSVVITEDGQPAGIVTERDIMKSIGYGKVNLDTIVGKIMSKPLISIGSDATLGEAADMMIKRKVRRLLVKENDKYYVGIITQRDLQRLMTDTFRSLLLI